MRGLIKFIEKQAATTIYTALDDQIGEATEVTLQDFSTGINMVQYRKRWKLLSAPTPTMWRLPSCA